MRTFKGDDGPMKVAIVHYWLVGMRGGEKVIEALCRIFPEADIITHVVSPPDISDNLRRHPIKTTFISRLPLAKSLYQSYLPLMPLALEQLDMQSYDLVLSSEAGPAKGIIAPPHATHISYVHSPMRYIWDQYHTYRAEAGLLARLSMPFLAHGLRQWDVTSAARIDGIIANSKHVAARIQKYWNRSATVIHPPVSVEAFTPVASSEVGDFYLWAGQLVPYKRPDLVIDTFNASGKPLVVIGGPNKEVRRLRKRAKDNITFLGSVSFEVLASHMARCRALVFPGEEDFGIIPVETMAAGRPVIAYGMGGARDTVVDGRTGTFFETQSVDSLSEAVDRFEAGLLQTVDPVDLVKHAQTFSEPAFRQKFLGFLASAGVEVPSGSSSKRRGESPATVQAL